MRIQKQAYRHKPEEGIFGDCHRTCIAMMLDMDKLDVPHFGEMHPDDGKAFNLAVEEWLRTQGWSTVSFAFNADPEDVMLTMRTFNPGAYYMLSGRSRTGVNHTVICLNDQILADPSLTDAGIVGRCDDDHTWVVVLVPMRMTQAGQRYQKDPEYEGLAEDVTD